ncbi:lytic murein transglycosylase [Roseibium denhamense]|uniref:Lytic murein transglycosylase n=1 Tax=Roseibium denhamense TaxID=76305 RepID=A0ABY1PLH1_9HYPH|nr:lytic murein transglycosylase [Roseibium denhamense]MTI06905.1 lytic murein transglycosylase [Roseibium denhamense]SMP36787.1 lytic murein transglycosylase [Roseibium denhamense]
MTHYVRRLALWFGAALLTLNAVPHPSAVAGQYDAAFRIFLQSDVIPAARRAGVSQSTLTRELNGLTPDTSLPGLVGPGGKGEPPRINFQAEFRAPARYFRDSQFNALVPSGRRLMQKHASVLSQIEAQYGVPKRIILAIWARESGYGGAKIPHDAVRVLATRAFMGQRPDFFKSELIAALQVLQNGDVSRRTMRSSWGGAMGQPQFLPSSYLKYAVDFDRDGKRNIWTSEIDTMASIANYLAKHGWKTGRDWGYEVHLPDTVSCTREGPDNRQPINTFVREGVNRVSGRPFPEFELNKPGNILMPAGRYGPAFIATENFYVLKEYNESDAYALFVGHLADRYGNNKGFVADWKPMKETTRGAVRTLQQRLEAQGHDVGGADGLIGFKTRRSIGKDQERQGFFATCWVG